MQNLSFFAARVGRLVFFSAMGCKCPTCVEVFYRGYLILSPEDAIDVYKVYLHILKDQPKLKVFDTIEERDRYNSKLWKSN